VARDAQLAAEIEQVVLISPKRIAQLRRQFLREQHPIAEFSSSISPSARTRGLSLGTREPSPSPVSPASPVRV